jgi:hypothetical protein
VRPLANTTEPALPGRPRAFLATTSRQASPTQAAMAAVLIFAPGDQSTYGYSPSEFSAFAGSDWASGQITKNFTPGDGHPVRGAADGGGLP